MIVYILINRLIFYLFQKVKGLPYNKYTWLMTHNSYARIGAKSATGSMILAPSNQQDSITSQLIVNILHNITHSKVSFFPKEKKFNSLDKPISKASFFKFDALLFLRNTQ